MFLNKSFRKIFPDLMLITGSFTGKPIIWQIFNDINIKNLFNKKLNKYNFYLKINKIKEI